MSEFSYAALTTPQRWRWHAGVYAFRRVVLGVPREERTSPCDPRGEWFDAALVDAAERQIRLRRAAKNAEEFR